jgi:hypothetical protein
MKVMDFSFVPGRELYAGLFFAGTTLTEPVCSILRGAVFIVLHDS